MIVKIVFLCKTSVHNHVQTFEAWTCGSLIHRLIDLVELANSDTKPTLALELRKALVFCILKNNRSIINIIVKVGENAGEQNFCLNYYILCNNEALKMENNR